MTPTLHLSREAFTALAGPIPSNAPPAAEGAARVAIAARYGVAVEVYDCPGVIVFSTSSPARLTDVAFLAAGMLAAAVALAACGGGEAPVVEPREVA